MDFDRELILQRVNRLMNLYSQGILGGETMPENANPGLDAGSAENYAYFTLPMALNYQRNSYKLWLSALQSYQDPATQDIFSLTAVKSMDISLLQPMLAQYSVALQPNKQPVIWKTICTSFADSFDGDIRNLFLQCDYSALKTKQYLAQNKKKFPYLNGIKISNYWLYVMQRYTDLKLTDRENISIAPDTHVVQASVRLGIISDEEALKSDVQTTLSYTWESILKGTPYQPIDLHTPLWLWSRGKFSATP